MATEKKQMRNSDEIVDTLAMISALLILALAAVALFTIHARHERRFTTSAALMAEFVQQRATVDAYEYEDKQDWGTK